MAAPPHLVAEIIDGRLVTHPRPRPRQTQTASILGALLTGPFQFGNGGPGGWRILDEPELHLREEVVVPDLAGWRRERMPSLPETAWFELPPDWICEVISPSTARYDRGEKRDIYAAFGVAHLWHVDPDASLLEAFDLRDGHWVLLNTFRERGAVAAPPFAEPPFPLERLWPD